MIRASLARSGAPPATLARASAAALLLLSPSIRAAPPPETQPANAAVESAESRSEIEAALAADTAQPGPAATAPEASPSAPRGFQSLNPDLTAIADFALAGFSSPDPLEGGAHDPERDGFNFQGLELALGAAVDPYFRFDGVLAFDLEEGVDVEEAYATTLALPHRMQLRAGRFLTRFGRTNAQHAHVWDFVDQPFAITRIFGGEGNKAIGVELSYLTPLPWSVELIGVTAMADGAETHRSFLADSERRVTGPADLFALGAIKQFFPLGPDLSLSVGVSGAWGPSATGPDDRTSIYGADAYLKYRPITRESPTIVSLTSEWTYRRRAWLGGTLQDVSSTNQLLYRFAYRWAVAGRYEYGSPSVDDAIERVVFDPLDPEWTRDRHRLSGAFTFYPSEFSRLRAQVSHDLPGWRAPIWAGFLGLEVAVGAHGAHAF